MKLKMVIPAVLLGLGMFVSSQVEASNVIIPKGTEILGELVTPVNSKNSKVGDPIIFKVAKNFVLEDAIILPKGTNGRAKVTLAEKATYFGQGGQVGFTPESIKAANGVYIPLTFETARHGSAVNDANMVAATVGVGVFAAFFHGKNQTIPAGSKFKFFVAEDTDLKLTSEELGKYFYMLKK